jgi:hypothetical protein
MKQKFVLLILSLLLSFLVSSCFPYVNNPSQSNWPKYVPVEMPQLSLARIMSPATESCEIRAIDLLGAWVTANVPENDPFTFTDTSGKQCQGTFNEDILPLFSQANLWYDGSPSCRTCHGPDVQISYARLDLGSYQGILAGSSRDSVDTTGDDILGGGNWKASELYDVLAKGEMPPGQPADVNPQGPLIYAGKSK